MAGISNIQLMKIVSHRQSKNSIDVETENTKEWNCKIYFLKNSRSEMQRQNVRHAVTKQKQSNHLTSTHSCQLSKILNKDKLPTN